MDERTLILKIKAIADGAGFDQVSEKAGALTGKLGGISKAVGAGAIVGVGAFAAFGAAAVGAASDVAESQNKVNVVFGDSKAAIESLAASAGSSLGQTKGQVLEAAGTFGNLLTSLGSSKDAAADMSVDMIKLSSDLASFNNADPTEVLEALRSGLTGEAEPMKRFGVALNEVAMKQAAMKAGLGDNVQALSEAEKMQLRYNIIMEQTKTAQGDFANTSDGLANGMRIIKASMSDAVAEIGAGLLPAVEKAGKAFADFLQSDKFEEIKEKVIAVFSTIGDKLASIDWGQIADVAVGLFEKLGDVIGFLAENPAIGMIVGAIVGLVGAFAPLAAIIGPMIPVIMSIVGAFGSLGAIVGTIAALFNPVTLAIGAVIAIVVGLKLAWDNNLGGIQEKTAAVVQFVKDAWDLFVAKLKEVVVNAVQFVTDIAAKWEEFRANISTKLQEIGDNIKQKWDEFWTTITTKVQEIKDAVFNKWEEIKEAIGAALAFLKDAIEKAWDAYLKFINDTLDKIWAIVKDVWEKVKTFISESMEKIRAVIEEKWEAAKKLVDDAVKKIQEIIKNVFDGLKDIVDKALAAVGDTIKRVIEGWKTIIENALKIAEWVATAISGAVGAVGEALGNLIQNAVNAAKGLWETAVSGGLKIAEWVGTAITNAVSSITEKAGEIGKSIMEGVGKGFEKFKDALKSKVQSVINLLPQWLRDMLGIASPAKATIPIGEAVAEGIAVGFTDGLKRGLPGLESPIAKWVEEVRKMIGGAVYDNPGFRGGAPYDNPGFGGAPPYDNPGFGGAPPYDGRSPMTGWSGPQGPFSTTKVRPMQTGKGGFLAGSKSNFWQLWVARNGVPEESSARKTAEMLGIPIPDWLEDIWNPPGMNLPEPSSPQEWAYQVGEAVGGLVRVINDAVIAIGGIVGTGGGLNVGGPGGGITIGGPGGGGGGGKGPMPTGGIAVEADAVTVQSVELGDIVMGDTHIYIDSKEVARAVASTMIEDVTILDSLGKALGQRQSKKGTP